MSSNPSSETSAYAALCERIQTQPVTWLVTGGAGFIGSNLVETLLKLGQKVKVLDNLSTGFSRNLDQVRGLVSPAQWARCQFFKGDILDLKLCQEALAGTDYVLHQAALGSVPRSIEDPVASNASNVSGFLNMAFAAKNAGVKGFVYASSSAVYGDHPDLPKREERVGMPLSPYAVTKAVNEMYAEVFTRCYGFRSSGMRYFNVFGPRQDPDGAYAAVIPKWVAALIRNQPIFVNGDGETSRDFCYVNNVVQANLLAATRTSGAEHEVFNVALNDRTTLNQLFDHLRSRLVKDFPHVKDRKPEYRAFRAGDVRHSQADISKAQRILGYAPTHDLARGLDESLQWYRDNVV